ncbi:amyloid-beta-like protein [Amphibalanus amphitrite]|nr:amyloid-beta-like protein [Amphibalanus amphitrite]
MDWRNLSFIAILCCLKVQCSDGYIEAVGASLDATQVGWEKQVAMMCDKNGAKYHNQYMDESGRWVTDLEHNKGCMKSKSDILDYCKMVYPGFDFLNVVQSTHSHLIEDWCKVGHKKCQGSFWVQPFQCLQGNSEAPSLSVPDTCLFDQLKNVSLCKNFHSWSKAANKTCKNHGMGLYSILTQYPCGSEVFNGAEFVCCPRGDRKTVKPMLTDADVEQETQSATSEPEMEERSTRDPYYTKFDPRIEHDAFKAAERRLETSYHKKITKIMKEWTELEERYQKIKYKNPLKADKFKLKMTERFNRMMNALKDQGYAEKHQLVNLHQQRIIAHINERKKDGMKCFVKSLNEKPQSTAAVRKCLTHLIRALHKDRHHTISHYNHLLLSSGLSAGNQRDATIEHLQDVDRMINESLQMLDHYPDLKDALLVDMTRLSAELRSMLPLPEELQPRTTSTSTSSTSSDEADDADDEDYDDEDDDDDEDYIDADDTASRGETLPAASDPIWNSEDANRIDIDVEVERRPAALPEHRLEPIVAHVRTHEHVQGEATFRVVGEVPSPSGGRGLYLTVALASLALTVALVAAAWAVRRRQRAPQRQGFIEVDQTVTPEERHLAQMQVNGYENPTYRYFESK